jgi:hypothetical protein
MKYGKPQFKVSLHVVDDRVKMECTCSKAMWDELAVKLKPPLVLVKAASIITGIMIGSVATAYCYSRISATLSDFLILPEINAQTQQK